MGFLDGLRKMMQGKPVFEDPNQPAAAVNERDQFDTTVKTPDIMPAPVKTARAVQQKVVPTFDLKHCETHVNDDVITVTVWATNTSKVDIEIDKCVILNVTTQIDRRLSPGQAHEVTLYKGRIPKNDQAHKANIFYKAIRENEYFRVDFMVEYNREGDGSYTVEELHPEHYPVKEIM